MRCYEGCYLTLGAGGEGGGGEFQPNPFMLFVNNFPYDEVIETKFPLILHY